MTIARNEQEALPKLARLWTSVEGMPQLLAWRFSRACLIIALVPVFVGGLGAVEFWDELRDAYSAGAEAWGWRIVAVGEAPRAWISIGREPLGFVAIGTMPVGVMAIGDVATGVVAIGLVCVGAVSVSVVSLGLWSLGLVSIGWVACGTVSTGWIALGNIVGGWYACGKQAIGVYAWGFQLAWGFKRAQRIAPLPPAPPPETERLLFPNWPKADPDK